MNEEYRKPSIIFDTLFGSFVTFAIFNILVGNIWKKLPEQALVASAQLNIQTEKTNNAVSEKLRNSLKKKD